jgi:hypothetical protein
VDQNGDPHPGLDIIQTKVLSVHTIARRLLKVKHSLRDLVSTNKGVFDASFNTQMIDDDASGTPDSPISLQCPWGKQQNDSTDHPIGLQLLHSTRKHVVGRE